MANLKLTPIKPETVSFYIKGMTPLIQHQWSEKAKDMLRMTAAERRKQPKRARDPKAEAFAAMYTFEDGTPGLPAMAFKAALISAAHKDLGIEKTVVRKAFFVNTNGLLPMECSDPVIREDLVRVGNQQADLRYRPEFHEWRCKITATIDPDMLTQQDVVNLVNRAGFSVGIGEWRPEKGGENGRFEFDNTEVMEILK